MKKFSSVFKQNSQLILTGKCGLLNGIDKHILKDDQLRL
jgi:hypothetical protein